jgi:hypothetical protein
MKFGGLALFTVMVLNLGISGCATFPNENRVAADDIETGLSTTNDAAATSSEKEAGTETAGIDGLRGSLSEGAIGHYTYEIKKTRQQTERKYGFPSDKTALIRIETVSAGPSILKPGEKTELAVTYAVLGASPNQQLNIAEIREIRLGDRLIGTPVVNVIRKGGTYTSRVPLSLPSDAGSGTYKVLTIIQTADAQASGETTFIVRY